MKARKKDISKSADTIEVAYEEETGKKKGTLAASGTVAIVVVVIVGMLAMGLGMAWLLVHAA